jgi:hypothetical protein
MICGYLGEQLLILTLPGPPIPPVQELKEFMIHHSLKQAELIQNIFLFFNKGTVKIWNVSLMLTIFIINFILNNIKILHIEEVGIMYERFMTLIENNADKITKNLLQEIQKREETRHYRELSEDVTIERISQVIRNVYNRLGNWLNKNKPKNTLFAYYSDLGAQRCREGIPLDEVVMVLMLIKREIWHTIRDQISVDSGFTLNLFMEVNFYVNLFFDRIIHSTVTGYQIELGKICEKAGSDKPLLSKIFKK